MNRKTEFLAKSNVDAYREFIQEFWVNSSDRDILLRYEDLLNDPVGVLNRLCRELHIDFNPSKLNVSEKVAQYSDERRPRATSQAWKTNSNCLDLVRNVSSALDEEIEILGYSSEYII